MAAFLASCSPEPPPGGTTSAIDLLAPESEARRETPEKNPDYVARWTQSVAGESRDVLFMHPPSKVISKPVRLTLESRLELSFGVNEMVWDKEGDGVTFSVLIQPAGAEPVRVYSVYLDPKHVQEDRRWKDGVVSLGMYAGREASLIFATDPGPSGNFVNDWAGWSRAELFLGPR